MSSHAGDEKRELWVLVVDDDPRVRLAMAAELTAVGWHPTAVGPDQLTLTDHEEQATEFDVALVDVALPTVTAGLTVITALALEIPVVAFSINGASRDAALAAGASAYLEKDGNTDRLLDVLHSASTTPTCSPHHRRHAHGPHRRRSPR
jgi:CheY-like chemotaxis protein